VTRFLALAALLPQLASAQTLPIDAALPIPGVRYSGVPVPELVIGHRIGNRHTRADQIVTYFEAVDRVSDRVMVAKYGDSYEGRPMIYAVVTSPANHRRLAEIKKQNRRLREDPASVSDADVAKMPLILWMGYNVHGNEASASEAAILFLYHLAAGQGKSIDQALDECVIVIAPCYNPDGRDRFANWVNQNRGLNATSDTNDREHNEPWPGGRTNHYGYDLNRDWMPLTQVESATRHPVWLDFYPQVTTDYHEQGSRATYFFQPGVPTRVHPLTPVKNQKLTEEIGHFHARALEAVGELYFTEERFDDFYIGKGSTYPDVAGSVGILFEQASSRSLQTPTDSRLLTFAITVRNQVATCLSTLAAGIAKREELLRYQRDFFADSLAGVGVANWSGIELTGDFDRLSRLVNLLMAHEIKVFQNGNAFWVPMKQPKARLIQAMFERRTEFTDNQFYDISAWSLDLAFDVRAEFRTDTSGREDFRPVGSSIPAAKIMSPPVDFDDIYVYTAPWGREGSAAFLQEVLAAGAHAYTYMIRTPPKGANLALGTLVIPTESPIGARLEDVVREASVRHKVPTTRVNRGDHGILSLGGNATSFIPAPRVALIAGAGSDVNNTGELWQLMDRHWGIPVSLIDGATAGDLDRYNTIVMAGGRYPASLAEPLTAWISRGGRLVASASAVDWVSSSGIWTLESRSYSPKLGGLSYGELTEERGRHALPGAIFQAEFDSSHPMAFGLPRTLPVFREGNTFYAPPATPGATVARYAENPMLAGYMSKEVAGTVQRAACVLARRQGSGSVILIMDNPHFRAFFVGPNRLLANAVFFGSSF